MERKIYAIVLAVLALAFVGCIRGVGGDTPADPAHTADVMPQVYAALDEQAEVEVLISLANPPMPMEQWTIDIQRQNAAEREARVLAVLDEDDFTLTTQFELAAALGGSITMSGVEKLLHHPDVVGIGVSDFATANDHVLEE